MILLLNRKPLTVSESLGSPRTKSAHVSYGEFIWMELYWISAPCFLLTLRGSKSVAKTLLCSGSFRIPWVGFPSTARGYKLVTGVPRIIIGWTRFFCRTPTLPMRHKLMMRQTESSWGKKRICLSPILLFLTTAMVFCIQWGPGKCTCNDNC